MLFEYLWQYFGSGRDRSSSRAECIGIYNLGFRFYNFYIKAAYKGHPDLTRLLIIYGVYPKKIDAYGQTVLHLACLGGNLNIVQQLIEQVGLKKIYILRNWQIKMNSVLHKDSIDTEIRDKNGKKAIDLAKSMGNSEIVDLIDRHYRNRRNYGCHMK